MRSLERHRDVGAYALGVLDEAESFRFEDHLMDCASCTAHVTEFGPATRQLMLYRRATPRSVHPLAGPGARLLERLLGEVAARHRAGRRLRLYAVAAAVALAVAGPGAVVLASGGGDHGGTAVRVTATDERSGVWARVTSADETWGSRVEVTVKDAAGPRVCRLVAVGHDGSEETVTTWTVPRRDARPHTVNGGAALHLDEIDHYEVRTTEGTRLVTLTAP
ncbi:zf-HC2 domain-containing protein [Streptomyces sp. NPDC006997]|uniref:zf-HC2 domain-containing protein n=1 Tax=Streptomyces sp. NPDC006997 TaxID=3155356 RepID=UPI0033F30BB6